MEQHPQLVHGPGKNAPWRDAIERQIAALDYCSRGGPSYDTLEMRLDQKAVLSVSRVLLKAAVPFAWNAETMSAVLSASHSIPDDSKISTWNLNTDAAWWHFEQPLPLKQFERTGFQEIGIRALSMGWFTFQPDRITIPAGSPINQFEQVLHAGIPPVNELYMVGWSDHNIPAFMTWPSLTGSWKEGDTIAEMLAKCDMKLVNKRDEELLIPPDAVDNFRIAVSGVCKFILAGLAWLDQRIVVEEAGHIERHRRKEFNRKTEQSLDHVKVINLRRVEKPETTTAEQLLIQKEMKKVNWSCRWEVDGFWRQQPCGPNMIQRKLIWVSPFLKGPKNMPFRVPKNKVYRVNR